LTSEFAIFPFLPPRQTQIITSLKLRIGIGMKSAPLLCFTLKVLLTPAEHSHFPDEHSPMKEKVHSLSVSQSVHPSF
jgi:hypothetical protein